MSALIYILTPFTPPIVTRNSTDLMAFTFTPSLKENILLDLVIFTKNLSQSFNMSKKISNHSFPVTVRE